MRIDWISLSPFPFIEAHRQHMQMTCKCIAAVCNWAGIPLELGTYCASIELEVRYAEGRASRGPKNSIPRWSHQSGSAQSRGALERNMDSAGSSHIQDHGKFRCHDLTAGQ